jgi:predicted phage replisome organizer
MSDDKKYYYLKLKDNFFDRAEIKAIESMQSGYEYICIIQKMYLRSLSRNGKLMLTDTIPYDLRTLSSVLGHKQDTIKTAVDVFSELGLCELLDDKSIYMTEIQKFIGESSTEADRKREYRLKINENKQKLLANKNGQMSGQMSDKSPPELNIEKELKLKLKKEIKDNNIYKNIFNFWNEQNIIKHNIKKLDNDLKKRINKALKKYSEKEVLNAIKNYSVILCSDDYFWTYSWGLFEFLKLKTSTTKARFEIFLDDENPYKKYKIKGQANVQTNTSSQDSKNQNDNREEKGKYPSTKYSEL